MFLFAPVRLIGKYWRWPHVADGQVGLDGGKVRFRAGVFRREVGAGLAELIAHELAHVYQHATKQFRPETCEADADRLVREWGFAYSKDCPADQAIAAAEEADEAKTRSDKGGN